MKLFTVFLVVLLSTPLQAACKCNCEKTDNQLCASWYDLDNPCLGFCPTTGQSTMRTGKTACPRVKVFNTEKRIEEWQTQCFE